jgi:hypothetical protein
MGTKDKAMVVFRRLPDGNIVDEIVDPSGTVFMSKNFGDLSKDEIDNVLYAFKEMHPEVDILPNIEVAGN